MIIDPEMWRQYFKPRMAFIISEIKKINPDIAVAYHTDGYNLPIIPDEIESGAWRLHHAPAPEEYKWDIDFEDTHKSESERDFYYVRVRQTNDQWAWSSPIFLRD